MRHASRAALAASGELLPSSAAQWFPLPDEALFTKALGLDRLDLSVVEVWRERQDSPLNDCQQTAQLRNPGRVLGRDILSCRRRPPSHLGRDHLGSSRHARIGPKDIDSQARNHGSRRAGNPTGLFLLSQ